MLEHVEGMMHVISRKVFTEATRRFPNDAAALDATYRTLNGNDFADPDALRAYFPSLDRMKYRAKWWVINVGGNNLRVMFFADFIAQRIFIKHVVTHAEYDKWVKHYREKKE
jgi:mRNA interferase HigB